VTARPRGSSGRRAVTGYVPGVFDMFHIGHLNILRRARIHCDHLVAGVVSDEVALAQKGRPPVIGERERLEIVAAMRVVDTVHLETTTDKLATWTEVGFDVVFKGDDWKGTPKWTYLEREFAARGVRVVYLPYTPVTSSSERREFAR
jgi:glycerol-3-phosphate cytidylyltransferase